MLSGFQGLAVFDGLSVVELRSEFIIEPGALRI